MVWSAPRRISAISYGKSHEDLFIGAVKRGWSVRDKKKRMVRTRGAKCAPVRGMKRLVKSADSGLEWRWDRGRRLPGNFLFFYGMHARSKSGEGREEGGGGERERDLGSINSVIYPIRHVVVFDLPRSVSRSVGRERVYGSREIGTLRKNVTCTHTRRRSSRTSRRRVRSRLDSPLGRW